MVDFLGLQRQGLPTACLNTHAVEASLEHDTAFLVQLNGVPLPGLQFPSQFESRRIPLLPGKDERLHSRWNTQLGLVHHFFFSHFYYNQIADFCQEGDLGCVYAEVREVGRIHTVHRVARFGSHLAGGEHSSHLRTHWICVEYCQDRPGFL